MKYVSLADAVGLIKNGDSVYVQGAASIPNILVKAMSERSDLKGVKVYSAFAICKEDAPYAHKAGFEVISFFVNGATRGSVNSGEGDYIPSMLGEIPVFFRTGVVPLDVVLLNVSEPDEHGFCSLGVSVDLSLGAIDGAKTIIAQVNKYQPRVFGDAVIHVNKFSAMVRGDDPLVEIENAIPSDVDIAIGKYIAERIPDGATLQIGVGGIPNAVLGQLGGHKNLGVHTEALTEGMVDLINNGVINNSLKAVNKGFCVGSLAVGSRRLYDFMHNNPSLLMKDVVYTNDPFIIRQNPNVRCVNSAIEVDLTGQVVSDSIGERIFSGVGGQHDFMYGGNLCPTGKTFIALPSITSKGASKIVANLSCGGGVVTPRSLMQHVVTEYGVAELRGKSLKERAKALIAIAHPSVREELDKTAFLRFKGQF